MHPAWIRSPTDSVDACFTVLGLDSSTVEDPRCGDAYVAGIDRR